VIRGRALAAALVLLVAPTAAAQTADPVQELAALRAVVEAREVAEVLALRRRWRLAMGLGVAAATAFDVVHDEREVRFEGGFAGVLSATLTRGLTDFFDVFARVELSAPLRATTFPDAVRDAVADLPCAGSRRFELPQGIGGLGAAEMGLRLRVLDPRSRFFVGLGVRVAGRWTESSGPWSVRCEALDGTRAQLAAGTLRESPVVLDLGATAETGYQFGETRAWETGLRLSLGGIADGDITARLAQWYIAWSPW
jgi:hypothetical protein